MKVRVTDDAKADLREIKTFISERDAIAAAGVIDRIRKTLTLLAFLPRLGHPGLVHGTFERGVPRVPYLIVYRIDMTDDDRELVVLRVYHGTHRGIESERCARGREFRLQDAPSASHSMPHQVRSSGALAPVAHPAVMGGFCILGCDQRKRAPRLRIAGPSSLSPKRFGLAPGYRIVGATTLMICEEPGPSLTAS